MDVDVQELFLKQAFTPDGLVVKTRETYDAILRHFEHLDEGNFTRIYPNDLEILFELYEIRSLMMVSEI